MRQVLEMVHAVLNMPGNQAFHSLHLSAAGSDSTVLNRFKQTLSKETGLVVAADEGDLWLRLRRPPDGSPGWDLLVRLTPRPLSTRSWRVCNMQGALNATVANAMARLARPGPDDIFLNLACGSGTLLTERLSLMGARLTIGVDINQAALACAQQNLSASGYQDHVSLIASDGCRLPLRGEQLDTICADLPFGQLVGTHDQNLDLYPALMGESERVLRRGGRLVVITHEVRLMQRLLPGKKWALERTIPISLSGLHPRIYVLRKKP
jgi:23S rRNA G2445 N2-methylase RlmL